ncbi:MAG: hypothetical protein L6R39_006821, partial [Caloplaca ligustica]
MHFTFTTTLCALFLIFATALTAPTPIFNPNAPVARDAARLASLDAPPPPTVTAADDVNSHYRAQSENFA